MEYGITKNGFVVKPFTVIQEEQQAAFRQIFGDDIDLSPESVAGAYCNNQAIKISQLWEILGGFYAETDVGSASGVYLDRLAAFLDVKRQDASPTQVAVALWGNNGTIVPAGNLVRSVNGQLFSLMNKTTILQGHACGISIKVSSSNVGDEYKFTVDGVAVEYVARDEEKETVKDEDGEDKEVVVREKDTKESVRRELIEIVEARLPGTFIIDPSENDVLKMHLVDGSGNKSVVFDNFSTETLEIKQVASIGRYSCTVEGIVYVAQREINQIVTNMNGLDTVINYVTGTTGRNVETDDEFRVAIKNRQRNASGNEIAIQNAVEKLPNVEYARVYSNRTINTDIEGRPPKSFECVVINGNDEEIANTIFNTAPAGIEPWGNTEVIVKDIENYPWKICFSRPEYAYAWVKIVYELNGEEVANSNIERSLKDAIVAWGNENLKIGTDLIVQRLFIPIYSVSGLKDVELTVCALPNTTTPNEAQYKFQDIKANDRTIIVFDRNRMTIEEKERDEEGGSSVTRQAKPEGGK